MSLFLNREYLEQILSNNFSDQLVLVVFLGGVGEIFHSLEI